MCIWAQCIFRDEEIREIPGEYLLSTAEAGIKASAAASRIPDLCDEINIYACVSVCSRAYRLLFVQGSGKPIQARRNSDYCIYIGDA